MKTYLVKVRYALTGLLVYKVETEDLYHDVGKLVLRSIEKIEDIRYSDWTQEREDFWIENGYTIYNGF